MTLIALSEVKKYINKLVHEILVLFGTFGICQKSQFNPFYTDGFFFLV